MGFSRHEYWSGLPSPPLGDLPDPGIKPTSLTSPALAGEFFTPVLYSVSLLCYLMFFAFIISLSVFAYLEELQTQTHIFIQGVQKNMQSKVSHPLTPPRCRRCNQRHVFPWRSPSCACLVVPTNLQLPWRHVSC